VRKVAAMAATTRSKPVRPPRPVENSCILAPLVPQWNGLNCSVRTFAKAPVSTATHPAP
jgi:hypothetical protein